MAKGEGRPLATKQQIRLAEKGIGRITSKGRYQSPREVASRAIREQRRQLKRLITKYKTQYNELQSKGYYTNNQQAEQYTKEVIKNAESQLKTITNLKKEKAYKEEERKKQLKEAGKDIELTRKQMTRYQKAADTMAKKRYTSYLNKIAKEAAEQSSYMKTQTIRSVGTRQGRYKAYEKSLWSAIFAYTYGDKRYEGGLWESDENYPDEDTIRKMRKEKKHTEAYDKRIDIVKGFVKDELGMDREPTDIEVFEFFEKVIGVQYGNGGDFSLVDFVISPDYNEKYKNIEGGIRKYTRK